MEKKRRINIVSGVLITGFILCVGTWAFYTSPVRTPKAHKPLVAKIDNAKMFREEAKALALSLPILSDSIIAATSDSLFTTLMQLNRAWVIFVKTEEGFEEYTHDVEKLNMSLDKLRMEFEIVRAYRMLNGGLVPKKIIPKKKKTQV